MDEQLNPPMGSGLPFDAAERRSIEAMRQREQIRDVAPTDGRMRGERPRFVAVDEFQPGPGDDPIAEWQIVYGWICEIGDDGEPEPMVELAKLPGFARWLDSITPPAWQYTPEGHDDQYEYTTSSDCDGSHVQRYRRTPARRDDAGDWEKVDTIPPVEQRTLRPLYEEEPRP